MTTRRAPTGTIRDVVYLGSDTRYVVALDAGSELVVTAQNLTISSMEALAAQGRSVRLIWRRQYELPGRRLTGDRRRRDHGPAQGA